MDEDRAGRVSVRDSLKISSTAGSQYFPGIEQNKLFHRRNLNRRGK
jgi:hypothetical protein